MSRQSVKQSNHDIEQNNERADWTFVVGVIITMLPQFVFASVVGGPRLYLIALIVVWGFGSIVGFASYNLKRH